jgi:hypothetical protein
MNGALTEAAQNLPLGFTDVNVSGLNLPFLLCAAIRNGIRGVTGAGIVRQGIQSAGTAPAILDIGEATHRNGSKEWHPACLTEIRIGLDHESSLKSEIRGGSPGSANRHKS